MSLGVRSAFRRVLSLSTVPLLLVALVTASTGPATAEPTAGDFAGAQCPHARNTTYDAAGAALHERWLRAATQDAGIDLDAWNPRDGVQANAINLERSYDLYMKFQREHPELRWSGMGGLSGSDFGGGLLDMDLASTVYHLQGVQPFARQITAAVRDAAGEAAVDQLPSGLRALAHAPELTPADLDYIIGEILIMQKAIFCDLMPMHQAYVTDGLPALEEMNAAGVFPDEVMAAWRNVASGDPARAAAGNAVLLQREQDDVIADRWNGVRHFRDGLGEALTYASTVVGSPSVGGVEPMRSYRPIVFETQAPDGRTAIVTVPLPSWDWSVLKERWSYIEDELLPGYNAMADNHWDELYAQLSVPQSVQMQQHRPITNLVPIVQNAADTFRVELQ